MGSELAEQWKNVLASCWQHVQLKKYFPTRITARASVVFITIIGVYNLGEGVKVSAFADDVVV